MRYKPEYKAEARAKLLQAAGALAKEKGFGTTGVDEFMAAAGMTSGAFYSHFGSKAAFLSAIIANELDRSRHIIAAKDRASLLKALRKYLSLQHVEHPALGCPLPSLSSEIARADTATRQIYEDNLQHQVAAVGSILGDEALAWALLSQVVGAVTLARAMASEEARKAVLNAAIMSLEQQLGDSAAA